VSTGSAGRLVFEVGQAGLAMRPEAVTRLRDYLSRRLEEGFPASFSLVVAGPGGIAIRCHGGYGRVVTRRVPVKGETSYDLASITKVVCTVTLALVAAERGLWALDDPVARWLPRYPVARTSLWHLLTHTSGLVGHRPFYANLRGRQAVEAAVYREAAGTEPGHVVLYSDLGFMLAGWAIEACLGKPFDELFTAEVARPLGMARARFRPSAHERPFIAATELDSDQRPTPGLIWGEVHDGNAWALGGVAGHAGLFAPATDLARFVRFLLTPGVGGPLAPASVELMSSQQAETGGDARGLGWRLRPEGWGRWPETTMWHTGFTGTSLLVDRCRGVGVVFLANAIHPRRRLAEQEEVRAQVHRLVAEAVR
jgi:CubicO group peptidase (beta-lactamase class C family)